jgi:hypothetical protein
MNFMGSGADRDADPLFPHRVGRFCRRLGRQQWVDRLTEVGRQVDRDQRQRLVLVAISPLNAEDYRQSQSVLDPLRRSDHAMVEHLDPRRDTRAKQDLGDRTNAAGQLLIHRFGHKRTQALSADQPALVLQNSHRRPYGHPTQP